MLPARTSTALLVLALAWPLTAATPSREVLRTVPLAADGHLSIDTYKGTVAVTTWERAEVSVKARIEADGDCSDAGERVEKTEVEVESSGTRARVKSDYSHLPHGWTWSTGGCNNQPFVHYEISMPRTAALHLKDYKSDSKIAGLAADADVETYKGTVRIEGLDGGLRLETYKGDARVELVRLARDVKAQTYKGTIEITAPRSASFTFDAESGKGDLDVVGFSVPVSSRHRHAHRASGDVNGGGPRFHLSTHKGTLRLTAR